METAVEGWFDSEVKAALAAILGAEAAKKRATVILLASATASNTPWARVFEDERACNQRVWYQKWQYKPEIRVALDLCTQKALALADAEIVAVEAQALRKRRRAIAEGSIDALHGLRMTALRQEDRADYRTEASRTLLALADVDLAARLVVLNPRGVPVEITEQPEQVVKLDVSNFPVEILRAIADGGAESTVAAGCTPGAGDAEPG